MTDRQELTVKNVERILLELPRARKNPYTFDDDGLTCLYTDENGEHCIAGEVLTRLGYEDWVPTGRSYDQNVSISTLLYNHAVFSGAVEEMLSELQLKADGGLEGIAPTVEDSPGTSRVDRRLTWGEAIDRVLDKA